MCKQLRNRRLDVGIVDVFIGNTEDLVALQEEGAEDQENPGKV